MADVTTRDDGGQPKAPAKTTTSSAPRTRRAPRWRLLTVLAVLGVVLWLLPTIIAKTPLFPWILKLATTDLNGNVTVRSVSLGWLSPIDVQGIEVKDAKGKTVLTIGSVAGDRRLGAILFNYSKLGKFTLKDTKLTVAMRDDGTNVEDLLARYLAPKKETSSTSIGLGLDIPDADVSIVDEVTGLAWQVQKFSLKLDMEGGEQGATSVDLLTDVRDPQGVGKINAGIKMGPAESTAKISVQKFPLAAMRAICARVAPGATLTGRLSSEVAASWGSKNGKNGVAANLNVEDCKFGAKAMQNDLVQLARIEAKCEATWQSDRLDIQKSSIQCDLGAALLTGTIPLGGKDGFSISAVAHQPQEFSGQVDLARLAQMLPNTLSLRSNLQIESGQVQWLLTSKPGPQGAVWHGQLETTSLTATDVGARRQIEPIVAVLDAHDVAGGEPIVDRLLCESAFLHVEGAGTTDNLTAKLSFNLNKLAEQLQQFINMGGLQLGGDGQGSLAWKRTPQRDFDANANIDFRGFQLGMTGQPVWREESLSVVAAAKGQTNFDANTRIDAATLNVRSGFDTIEAKLSEPVKDMRGGGVWPVEAKMEGQLQNWPARLAAWLPMNNVQLGGNYILVAKAVASKDGGDLRQMQFAAAPLAVNSPWANINEARIDGSAAGVWNQQQRRLQLPAASLKCVNTAADGRTLRTSVDVKAQNVVVALPAAAPLELAGTINYQADVGRIGAWLADPKDRTPWRFGGLINGAAVLQQTGGVVHGNTKTDLTNLALVDSTGKQFQEPIVQLAAEGDYDTQSKVLKLTQCKLTSNSIAASVAANVSPVNGRDNAQVEANINYDLERLTAILRPCIGSGIVVAGRGLSAASYRGPFSLAEGNGAVNFKWDGANLYGFPLGPAEIKATLADGAAQIDPLNVPLSGGGTVRLAPRLQLTSTPMVLSMPKGPLAQKVQINTAMCDSGLKYVAPVIAGATSAQGAFSIDLDDCRVPLGDMKKANIAGRLTVHSIVIGPGPMIRELAQFMNRAAPAKLKQESVVPFRMADGWVSHDNLELIFPDITIRTKGRVNVESKRMEITAQMPVPAKWQAGNTVLANAVKNQIITVPLQGTLTSPTLDKKVVAQLMAQFTKKAVGNILEGEANRALDRLLTPKK